MKSTLKDLLTEPSRFKTTLFFAIFFCFQLVSFAQTGFRIQGKIVEDGKEVGMPGAACVLLKQDSSIVTGLQSDEDGRFFFKELNPGKYILRIQYLGYETRFIPVSIDNEDVRMGPLALKEATSTLKAVNVVGRIPPVRQLGDTTQYNADGYKTNRDASAEELVTKMPGVTLQDGKVNVQGEEVKRILVDNKPFFGDDPSSALKNIPAEMIDKIQVFDQASEQSRFTGFNDGNTTKTINIVTRSGMRSGTFGKVYAGAGNDDRYKSGLVLNKFSGTQRISLLGQANNINEQNFSVSDLMG
ncbi:MAG TPA: carboxypeptidase-like regulatory domain-containing protein, partial [Catalimonadaceae bacterium]|nr:carboxypeptidase-like regulatory domain-containing protein [Catalimonadaceae bacterium]